MAGEERHKTSVEQLIRRGVLAINDGYRVRNSELGPVGIPFIRGGDIGDGSISTKVEDHILPEFADRVQSKLTRPFDVAFITKGTVGRVGILRPNQPPSVFAPQVCYWRSLDTAQLEPRFLFYLLRSREFQDNLDAVKTHGSMVADYVSMTDQRHFKLTVPPPKEQKVIAAVLGTLDDKIELNRRMNATLESMARALFRSWFVDFDPVRAKLDGRRPTGIDEATAALFPSNFQDSQHGPIPHGWHVGSIYEIADVIYGAPFASNLFNANREGKPLIRIRDLADESPGVWTPEVHPKGYTVLPGDIVVGMDGEFRAHLWGGAKAWMNQRVCAFAPKPGFSAAFVRNSIFAPLAQIEATETATTVIHLGKNDIDRFNVVIPDASVAEAFKRQCQRWYGLIVSNKQQSRTLATLRDALLPKLLNGEFLPLKT